MKKILLLTLLMVQALTLAQTQNLVNLAKGNYMGFNAVFDQKGNLYGYVAIYSYGISGEKTKKFEYVILDKNLNPVVNKEFQGDITTDRYYSYLNNEGKLCLMPYKIDNNSIRDRDFFIPRGVKVDLKDLSMSFIESFYYDGESILQADLSKSIEEYINKFQFSKKDKEFKYNSELYELEQNDILVNETKFFKKTKTVESNIIYFGNDKKELWRYEYTKEEQNASNKFQIILSNDKYIFATYIRQFVVLDKLNGKLLKSIPLENILPEKAAISILGWGYKDGFTNIETVDNNIYIYKEFWNRGFCRIEINTDSLEVTGKHLKFEKDLSNYIPKLDKYGGVEGRYVLVYRDSFVFSDGSTGIIMEKFNSNSGAAVSTKTTDLILIRIDKDFKVKEVKIFEKEKTKKNHGDYLFSQLLNDKKDVVFFYKDLVDDDKEKNWNLYINTIVNDTFKQEQIPVSSKENIIFPYVAKEGYILLQEFNKKEKYNSIRLERLNY